MNFIKKRTFRISESVTTESSVKTLHTFFLGNFLYSSPSNIYFGNLCLSLYLYADHEAYLSHFPFQKRSLLGNFLYRCGHHFIHRSFYLSPSHLSTLFLFRFPKKQVVWVFVHQLTFTTLAIHHKHKQLHTTLLLGTRG